MRGDGLRHGLVEAALGDEAGHVERLVLRALLADGAELALGALADLAGVERIAADLRDRVAGAADRAHAEPARGADTGDDEGDHEQPEQPEDDPGRKRTTKEGEHRHPARSGKRPP